MITGELKSQIDRIWDSFWSGGISNPLEVIEQAMERDKFFAPQEAKEFGLIDDVLEKRPTPTIIQAAAS